MVTKAIVQEVISAHRVRIRIPLYNKIEGVMNSTPDTELPVSPICTLPNIKVSPNVGDIVFVAFEEDDLSHPVVLGYLSMDSMGDALVNIKCDDLEAEGSIELGKDISIGDITYTNIECLKNLKDNILLEFQRIDKSLAQLDDAIEAVKGISLQNKADIEAVATDLQATKLEITNGIKTLNDQVLNLDSRLSAVESTYLKHYPTVLSGGSYGSTLPSNSSATEGQIFLLLK